MKVMVNYVIQDEKEHSHHSEMLEIDGPPYSCNSDPPIPTVMKWATEKQNTLSGEQKIVIITMYKIY